jgi:protoporphyrinogen oxidase
MARRLWETFSMSMYGKHLNELSKKQKQIVISEVNKYSNHQNSYYRGKKTTKHPHNYHQYTFQSQPVT